MKYESVWNDTKLPKYERLTKNISCDVLIIGGGISGLNLLYHLKNSHLNTVVVERNTLASGVTNRTSGKLTYFLDNVVLKVQKTRGPRIATQFIKAYKDGVNLTKKIITAENISCNLTKNTAYLIANQKKDRAHLKAIKNLYNDSHITFYNADTLMCNDTYVFHPLKYLKGLLKSIPNAQIYEQTLVYNIQKHQDKYLVKTLGGDITCRIVVFAGFYPYFLFPLNFPFNVSLEKSYIRALKVLETKPYNGITYTKPTLSYRYYENGAHKYLIHLANSHNLSLSFHPAQKFTNLGINNETRFLWSNVDILTMDGMPYAGKIKDNMYILTGYNTWGMAGSSISSKIVSDIILNRPNSYKLLFSPKRKFGFLRLCQITKNTFTNLFAYIGSMFIKNDKVKYTTLNGEKVAVVTLKDGSTHTVKTRCPHLYCNLIYNEVEHTWDCPCHASRFDLDGKVITGPSRYDISVKSPKTTKNSHFL